MSPKRCARPPSIEDTGELNFEQAFQELEAIVRRLEESQLPLAEALAIFERGQKLAAHCSALLDKAELKLSQLVSPEASPSSADLDAGEA